MRILLIDDDEINNFLSKELITLFHPSTEVFEIANAEDAINFLRENADNIELLPDIILIDINMPLMDGWEFIEQFQQVKNSSLEKIRIFIYTSSVNHTDVSKAMSYPAVVNIYSKPLTQQIFAEILKSGKRLG